jgi:peptidoglycan hydrolase CwlO-like protein
LLEREWENNLQPLETDNKNIKNEIDHIRQQIEFGNETARKLREDQVECDKQLQKINKDITELRNKIRISEDENSTKIRNMVDQFRQEKYDLEKRIEDAKQRVSQKERHLEQTEQELAALRRDYQKLVDSLKNNLANTISSTLNEYKGRHTQSNQYYH